MLWEPEPRAGIRTAAGRGRGGASESPGSPPSPRRCPEAGGLGERENESGPASQARPLRRRPAQSTWEERRDLRSEADLLHRHPSPASRATASCRSRAARDFLAPGLQAGLVRHPSPGRSAGPGLLRHLSPGRPAPHKLAPGRPARRHGLVRPLAGAARGRGLGQRAARGPRSETGARSGEPRGAGMLRTGAPTGDLPRAGEVHTGVMSLEHRWRDGGTGGPWKRHRVNSETRKREETACSSRGAHPKRNTGVSTEAGCSGGRQGTGRGGPAGKGCLGSELEALRGSCFRALSLSLWTRDRGCLNEGGELGKVRRDEDTVPRVNRTALGSVRGGTCPHRPLMDSRRGTYGPGTAHGGCL